MSDHNCFGCGHPVSHHSGQFEATGCADCDCPRWFNVYTAEEANRSLSIGEGRVEVSEAAVETALTAARAFRPDMYVPPVRSQVAVALEAAAPLLLAPLEAELSALKKAVTDEVERLRDSAARRELKTPYGCLLIADRLEQAVQDCGGGE